MNPNHSNLPSLEENRFDRLADGELSETDRRSLLASLDAEPDGWRRCALAFLEAQTWRESFGELTPPARTTAILSSSPTPAPLPKRKKTIGAMGTVMAMAASFLLTLGMGSWLLRSPAKNSLQPVPEMVAGGTSNVPIQSAGIPRAFPEPKSLDSTPWQMVKLRAPGLTGRDEVVQLPATPRERLDEDFWKTVPNPLPGDILEALKRTGCAVRTERELVPVQLEDGRRLIVPIDQVEVQYEGHQAY